MVKNIISLEAFNYNIYNSKQYCTLKKKKDKSVHHFHMDAFTIVSITLMLISKSMQTKDFLKSQGTLKFSSIYDFFPLSIYSFLVHSITIFSCLLNSKHYGKFWKYK